MLIFCLVVTLPIQVHMRPLHERVALQLMLQGLPYVMGLPQGHVLGEHDVNLGKDLGANMVGTHRIYCLHSIQCPSASIPVTVR